ncbi:MAG: MerR family transcriptional regulator [Deltaproteobacteria bacterium]|nr:MerR family transcriptional regulator [Deltaproteobacteria bacterium]
MKPSLAESEPDKADADALGQGKTYRIGEAAELLKLKSYVLRFWESEFPQLTPLRTGKGQRLYTEEHVILLRHIQELLHEKGMTIEGARRVLEDEGQSRLSLANLVPITAAPAPPGQKEMLLQCVEELEMLKQLLRPGPKI